MARFGDPAHDQHMHNGIRAALASPRTPAHLKPHLETRLQKIGTLMAKPNAKAPLGSGGRFAALSQKTGSPALAAWIGRKKWGKKKFQGLASKGRKSAKFMGF